MPADGASPPRRHASPPPPADGAAAAASRHSPVPRTMLPARLPPLFTTDAPRYAVEKAKILRCRERRCSPVDDVRLSRHRLSHQPPAVNADAPRTPRSASARARATRSLQRACAR